MDFGSRIWKDYSKEPKETELLDWCYESGCKIVLCGTNEKKLKKCILTERMFFPVDVIVKSVSKRTFESTVFLEAFFIDHDLPSGTAGIGTGTCDTGKFFIKSRVCYLHVLFSLTLCAIMFSKSITFCSVNYNERSHSWSNI